ncbi:MAG TPA: DUF3307 domain-containing protein [Bacilli bacterium]
MKIFLLLIAHCIGDFSLQPMALAVKKKESFKYQLLHSLIYTICLSLVFLLYTGILKFIVLFVLTFFIHLLIDYLRIIISKNKNATFQLIAFFGDQLLHIIMLIINSKVLIDLNQIGVRLYHLHKYVKIILGFALVLAPASVTVKHILFAVDQNTSSDICVDNDRVGSLIGKLERVIIVILGMMNLYTSIALVFTAKSLARFKQLEDKSFAERYLVGTFLSLLFGLIAIIIIKS